MAEAVSYTPWRYWAVFVGLAGVSLFWRMLPLGVPGHGLPGPDVLVCLVLAWVLRRPDYVPAPLVVGVIVLEDLLLMRPPGLWALMVLAGSEFLRGRQPLMRELPFALEWAFVAAVMAAMWLAGRLVLVLVFVDPAPLGASLVQLVSTMLAYPLVVLFSHAVLRVRKPATGEVDALGRPL
ncbi:rod shape-determining protein MreD [Rhodobaculum claviforme]|uniref:Rod shape-determining protein MreD n=1 Tax=Rhodobaculum claviforme TaxID=1549854 RepID=A0A934TKG5_9RHOB|nr:rod shape-determining protein MreD [Rhodobaculum claviforme]MBK5927219.1 rod shape-determining protein MreD [Rhodobaculum claviforme]